MPDKHPVGVLAEALRKWAAEEIKQHISTSALSKDQILRSVIDHAQTITPILLIAQNADALAEANDRSRSKPIMELIWGIIKEQQL